MPTKGITVLFEISLAEDKGLNPNTPVNVVRGGSDLFRDVQILLMKGKCDLYPAGD